MSHADHEWAKEQLAAHLAGGLPAEERARLEAHVGSCAECIAELDALRRFDRSMDDLFVPVRPKAGLEERVIRSLRAAPEVALRPFFARVGLAAAAVVLFGLVGLVFTESRGEPAPSPAVAMVPEAPPKPPLRDPAIYHGSRGGEKALYRFARGVESSGTPVEQMAQERIQRDLAGVGGGGRSGERLGGNDAAGIPHFDSPRSAEQFEKERAGKVLTRDLDLRGEAASGGELKKATESLDFVSDMPFKGKGTYDAIGGAVGTGKRENYYAFRNEAPANKPANPTFFLPGQVGAEGNKLEDKEPLKKEPQRPDRPPVRAEPKPQEPPQPEPQRKVIRSGEMEFEIDAFDSTVATITKIVGEERGFVATVNSEKLPNGKVRGTVVLRVPPDNLDTLLLKLRALGDLKSQRIGSQDVTKLYTDLESRLRAARTMEERLLKIIKEGKGEIKDLLQAEKELGEWRTKIETLEGEIRYTNNMISLSTLTVTLYEREIRSAFGVSETRKVQMGVEVEDVEKAHKDAEAAALEAKGRITKSELKKYEGGQFSAILHFEVAPEAAGPLQDRLRQLGTLARLEVDTDQQVEGGSGRAGEAKVKKNDSKFFVSLYNVANVAPRETVHVNIAAADAEAAYKSILARVERAGGRVVTSTLNRQKSEQTTGTVHFEIKSAEAGAVLEDVRKEGEVMRLQVVENPDAQNVTRSKRGFVVQLFALGLVSPRETTTVSLATRDVPSAYAALLEAISKAQARVFSSNLNEQDRQNVTANLDFEVRREHEKAVAAAMAAAGTVYTRTSARAQDVENVVDSKVRFQATLINVNRIPPREHVVLGIEVGDVDKALAQAAAEGRVIESRVSRAQSGRVVGRIVLDVPLARGGEAARKVRDLGTVRVVESWKDPKVADGELAVTRLDVTISNAELIVESGEGPWDQIKGGVAASLKALLFSLRLVVIGLCFVLPLGLVGWGGWRLYRMTRPKPA